MTTNPDSTISAQTEDEAWEYAVAKATAKHYQEFIEKYPNSVRATAARIRISSKTPLRHTTKSIPLESLDGADGRIAAQGALVSEGFWRRLFNIIIPHRNQSNKLENKSATKQCKERVFGRDTQHFDSFW
ncbi:MAG: hypothetical protein WCF85_21365 [Rhodospirillaceae bacterium]